MKESHTPIDQKELELRLKQFPKAVRIFTNSRDLLRHNSADVYVAESVQDGGKKLRILVDGQVLKAMAGGIDRMYRDLVDAGFKDFAEKTLAHSNP